MNIGMVLNSIFPPDVRVEKEARSLIEQGHKVYLLSAPSDNRPKEEKIEGIHVYRTNKVNPVMRMISSLEFCLTLQNELWRKEIESFVENSKINVLHIHDLPLVGTGMRVGQSKGIPIIA